MDILKKIPIKYKGELHSVRLINFSVDMEEVREKVSLPIGIREFGGRAMFSMVDVHLKKMRPAFLPAFLHFNYRHIAFRLLVEDSHLNKGQSKGIYFYQSFTNRPLLVFGGRLFTDYQLANAGIKDENAITEVRQGGAFVRYKTGAPIPHPEEKLLQLQKVVGALDRAYSMLGDTSG